MNVIKNQWPCCHSKTRFKDLDSKKSGDVMERQHSCGARFKITFTECEYLSLKGTLKMVWERLP